MSNTIAYLSERKKESKSDIFLSELAHFHSLLRLSQPPDAGLELIINTLLLQLKSEYPNAGSVYWSNRCWALIYWQPVYLAVYAVHKHHNWIFFNDFKLGFDNSSVSGFFFSKPNWLAEKTDNQSIDDLIDHQAHELKILLEDYFKQLSRSIRIHPINAWRLIADCILMVLLEIDEVNQPDKVRFSTIWLKKLAFYDRNNKPYSQYKQTEIKTSDLTHCKNRLVLKRKSCCMHFLIDPNNPCISCNKYSCKK